MEKSNGKVDVGVPVVVLSPGNEGRYGIVRANLGFHHENENFSVPTELPGEMAKAHRTDVWWWVEATNGPFEAYRQQVKITSWGPFHMQDFQKPEKFERAAMMFPDKELMPIPPIEDDVDTTTQAPVTKEIHPHAEIDA